MVRGPIVMLGYHGNPEATAETIEPDGWLHTGDIATMDATGHLFVVDRRKDMIITGGYNVYPAEIERVLAEHPAVAMVAAGPVPDPVRGELACAYVVLTAGATATEDELIQAAVDLRFGPADRFTNCMLRCSVLERPSPQKHLLVVAVNHQAIDGYSAPLLLSELATVYRTLKRGRAAALPVPPTSFSTWVRYLSSSIDATTQTEATRTVAELATKPAKSPAEFHLERCRRFPQPDYWT